MDDKTMSSDGTAIDRWMTAQQMQKRSANLAQERDLLRRQNEALRAKLAASEQYADCLQSALFSTSQLLIRGQPVRDTTGR